jgi:hypothetical protein
MGMILGLETRVDVDRREEGRVVGGSVLELRDRLRSDDRGPGASVLGGVDEDGFLGVDAGD